MSIVLEQLSKHYGNQWVVDNVSLEIADKELFVLLGSSGSGKSTILRMIAGLSEPTGGRIFLHGRDVTNLTPQERGTGFVFQNYSIFRHMTVGDNIEFGLRIRKVPRGERRRKREELLDLVGLAGLGRRYANQLSGGQQQRVALARALAYEPAVLLLDEPFGALDVKIRTQLRRSLKEIQDRLGVTTILVTHDQEEAFELADRIGVLERGRLLEVGPSESLYGQPKTFFTASFLGGGTVLVGRSQEGRAKFGPISLPIPDEAPHEEGARVQLLFRPEQVVLSCEDKPLENVPCLGRGMVVDQTFTGPLRRVRLRLPRLEATRQLSPPPPFGEEALLVDASLGAETPLEGNRYWVGLQSWTILKQARPHLLLCDTGEGSAAAVALTAEIAKELRASTTVVAVAENPDAGEQLRAKLTQRQQEAGLREAITHVRFGKAVEQIAAEQAEVLYEMLVITARKSTVLPVRLRPHKRVGLERRTRVRVLGETLVSILKYAEVPVLVVRGERTSVQKVLICTAAGEPGKSDVVVGGRLARGLEAFPVLLYVATNGPEPSPLTRSHLERAAVTLRSLDAAAEVRIRPAATAATGIIEEARENDFDLIVIGSTGQRTRTFLEMNDVMLEVLAAADRPVLVVPTDRA
jgi:sulfate transport system ATP-binding protein